MTKMPVIRQDWKYEKNKIALPTVGRVVYYYHPSYGGQPLAAMVAAVVPSGGGHTVNLGVLNPDGTGGPAMVAAVLPNAGDSYTVNLGVLNPDGTGGPAMNVPHESEKPPASHYWDWMPYQKGLQGAAGGIAAKTEELQRALDEKSVTPYAGGQGATGAILGNK